MFFFLSLACCWSGIVATPHIDAHGPGPSWWPYTIYWRAALSLNSEFGAIRHGMSSCICVHHEPFVYLFGYFAKGRPSPIIDVACRRRYWCALLRAIITSRHIFTISASKRKKNARSFLRKNVVHLAMVVVAICCCQFRIAIAPKLGSRTFVQPAHHARRMSHIDV